MPCAIRARFNSIPAEAYDRLPSSGALDAYAFALDAVLCIFQFEIVPQLIERCLAEAQQRAMIH